MHGEGRRVCTEGGGPVCPSLISTQIPVLSNGPSSSFFSRVVSFCRACLSPSPSPSRCRSCSLGTVTVTSVAGAQYPIFGGRERCARVVECFPNAAIRACCPSARTLFRRHASLQPAGCSPDAVPIPYSQSLPAALHAQATAPHAPCPIPHAPCLMLPDTGPAQPLPPTFYGTMDMPTYSALSCMRGQRAVRRVHACFVLLVLPSPL